jgi:hypothetical protein
MAIRVTSPPRQERKAYRIRSNEKDLVKINFAAAEQRSILIDDHLAFIISAVVANRMRKGGLATTFANRFSRFLQGVVRPPNPFSIF